MLNTFDYLITFIKNFFHTSETLTFLIFILVLSLLYFISITNKKLQYQLNRTDEINTGENEQLQGDANPGSNINEGQAASESQPEPVDNNNNNNQNDNNQNNNNDNAALMGNNEAFTEGEMAGLDSADDARLAVALSEMLRTRNVQKYSRKSNFK